MGRPAVASRTRSGYQRLPRPLVSNVASYALESPVISRDRGRGAATSSVAAVAVSPQCGRRRGSWSDLTAAAVRGATARVMQQSRAAARGAFPHEVSKQNWHHEWEAPFQTHVTQPTAGMLALYEGLVCLGVDVAAPLDGLVQVARTAGWWFPLEHTVFLTERPTAVHLDRRGRLHHRNGRAITYPDRFAVHARHGTLVHAPIISDPMPSWRRAAPDSDPEP